jgi:hypothetical protein
MAATAIEVTFLHVRGAQALLQQVAQSLRLRALPFHVEYFTALTASH